jgi:hypothetical protein
MVLKYWVLGSMLSLLSVGGHLEISILNHKEFKCAVYWKAYFFNQLLHAWIAMNWKFYISFMWKFPSFPFPSFISYKHSDENHLTWNGPPKEIPGENANKFKVTYTYSVKFQVSILCCHLNLFFTSKVYLNT